MTKCLRHHSRETVKFQDQSLPNQPPGKWIRRYRRTFTYVSLVVIDVERSLSMEKKCVDTIGLKPRVKADEPKVVALKAL